jgi:NADPH-dependent glutamate synthase beta subunit-like oxidoreductase
VLRVGIPEYRLPKKVLDLEIADIKGLGVGFGMKTALGRDVTLDGLRAEYDAVFLATGAHKSRRLGVPGEDLPGVVTGLSLLRRINAGERMDVGRRVLVVGGGNTAIDAARSAARLGAAVRVLYRRSRAEMPAHEVEIEEATREGVELRMLCAPVEVIAKDGRAAGLKCTQMRLGKPDASGRRAPEPIPGSEFVLEADTVVTAIGESADFSWAVPGLDAGGDDLVLDAWGRTTLVGVFAGGDAADVSHTVVDAIGAGKRAAIGIDRFLAGEPVDGLLPAIGERRGVSIGRYLGREVAHRQGDAGKVVRYADLNPAYFHETARGAMQRLAPAERRSGFDEVNLGLAPQEALAEARRCLHCGVCNACDNCYLFCPDVAIAHRADAAGYALDLDYCKGCGICVHECPRCAMLMEEDQ